MISVERYRRLALDTLSPAEAITGAIELAVLTLEEALRRPMRPATYTERLPVMAGGRVHPSAIVRSAEAREIIDSFTLRASPDTEDVVLCGHSDCLGHATVTYEGGWLDDELPYGLQRAIALVANGYLKESPGVATEVSDLLPRASSVKVGDVSVTVKATDSASDASASIIEQIAPGRGIWASIKGYRGRRIS